jgi:hypothetical protein
MACYRDNVTLFSYTGPVLSQMNPVRSILHITSWYGVAHPVRKLPVLMQPESSVPP